MGQPENECQRTCSIQSIRGATRGTRGCRDIFRGRSRKPLANLIYLNATLTVELLGKSEYRQFAWKSVANRGRRMPVSCPDGRRKFFRGIRFARRGSSTQLYGTVRKKSLKSPDGWWKYAVLCLEGDCSPVDNKTAGGTTKLQIFRQGIFTRGLEESLVTTQTTACLSEK